MVRRHDFSTMRPGIKVRLWSPRFKNRPSVEPPGLLRLVSALSILSIVGVLLYSVIVAVSGIGSTWGIEPNEALYIAIFHFVLPLCVAYTISSNHPISRLLIAFYGMALCTATVLGKGFLGNLRIDSTIRSLVSAILLLIVLTWLFRSPKMRYYYALVSGQPVPEDLQSRASELEGRNWISPKTRSALDWVADRMETILLLGMIVAVIFAFVSNG